ADSLPANAAFEDSGNGAGLFVFTPDSTQAGSYEITLVASDGDLADSQVMGVTVNDAADFLCGDANADGAIDVGDIVTLVSFLYRDGDPPSPMEAGDVNLDGAVNVGDVVYLTTYLYRDGNPPCEP
ncbi:MAG: dockerin type I repeat-containing protein, partial [Candidatus Zixiibacteriota bacterium]